MAPPCILARSEIQVGSKNAKINRNKIKLFLLIFLQCNFMFSYSCEIPIAGSNLKSWMPNASIRLSFIGGSFPAGRMKIYCIQYIYLISFPGGYFSLIPKFSFFESSIACLHIFMKSKDFHFTKNANREQYFMYDSNT